MNSSGLAGSTDQPASPIPWTGNLARFDLLSLRLAQRCVELGSLSAAASAQHLAIAAASRRLQQLEDAVGEPLFERHPRGLRPTAAGQLLAAHVVSLLHTLQRLDADLDQLRAGVSRHIRLCASTAAITQFLPPRLAAWAQAQPRVRVELTEQVSEAVVLTLREGRCDLAVFVEGPDTRGLKLTPFRRDRLALVLPPGHPLAQSRSPLRFVDTLGEDWIALNEGAALRLRLQQAALAHNRPLRLRMQVRSFDAVCHLVAQGLGISVLPQAAITPLVRGLKLRIRPLAEDWAERQLWLATLWGAAPDPDREALMAHLVKIE